MRLTETKYFLSLLLWISSISVGFSADLADLYRYKCESNDAQACFKLGKLYDAMRETNPEKKQALMYLEKACTLGVGNACTDTALHLPKKDPRTVALLLKACNLKSGEGCSSLAVQYAHGWGTKQDVNQSLHYYHQGCTLKDSTGCYGVGYAYLEGLGTARNPSKANHYFSAACKLGGGDGCSGLGYLYEMGIGVPRDYARAMRYYRQSCTLNYSVGCTNAGDLYRDAKGVRKDLSLAKPYYLKGCRLGDDEACRRLKTLYGIHFSERSIIDAVIRWIKGWSDTDVKLDVHYLSYREGWAWIETVPHYADGKKHEVKIDALLRKKEDKWKVVYVADNDDGLSRTERVKKDKTLQRFLKKPYGIVPLSIFDHNTKDIP